MNDLRTNPTAAKLSEWARKEATDRLRRTGKRVTNRAIQREGVRVLRKTFGDSRG